MHKVLLTLPEDMYQRLRKEAFEKNTSMSAIVQNVLDKPLLKKANPLNTVTQVKSFTELCAHGKEKTFCTVSTCPFYASWR